MCYMSIIREVTMNNKFNIKNIILILIILVLICINIILVVNKITLENDSNEKHVNISNNTEKSITTEQDQEKEILEQLKNMSERERMEFYFSEFMDYIENGKYQEAYNLLYPDFKDNYFKTLDDFKKYVNKTYPEFVSFSYNDIERQGNIYVLMITVINPDLSKSEAKKSQRIVIKENNFNDFVLSFQVI